MSANFADLLSTPGAASLFDSSAQASSLSSSYSNSSHVDLSDVDFDYLTQCNNPATLHSIIQQLHNEPFPELLQAARIRLIQIDDSSRVIAERKARESDEKQAMKSELEQWITQQKQKEHATTNIFHINKIKQQPPVRSNNKPAAVAAPAAAAEPVLSVSGVVGGKSAEEGVLSGEERSRRIASEKVKGNECYKAGEYTAAVNHYTAAITLLPHPHNTATTAVHPTHFTASAAHSTTASAAAADTFDTSLHTNLAMSLLRLGEYHQAVSAASVALNASHGRAVKAWWRRAQAYQHMEKYSEAVRDLQEAIKRAEDGNIKHEMQRDLTKVQLLLTQQQQQKQSSAAVKEEEEKRQVEERKEKMRADVDTGSVERLKRMTIVEDDSDGEDEVDEKREVREEKSSSQPMFKAPRGGMTIEVLQ